MVDRIVFADDLDGTRGLAEDSTKAYVKVDGETMAFNSNGQLKALLPTTHVNSIVDDGANIATILVNGTQWALFGKLTTIVKNEPTCSFTYTNEKLEQVTVAAADFLSQQAGNSLISNSTDGGLYFAAVAALPDDQVLTGDNTGSITFELTPTTVGDQTNYTIKGTLQLATTTPSAQANLAQLDMYNRLYVDRRHAQAGMSLNVDTATPALQLKDAAGNELSAKNLVKVTNLSGTISRGYFDLT